MTRKPVHDSALPVLGPWIYLALRSRTLIRSLTVGTQRGSDETGPRSKMASRKCSLCAYGDRRHLYLLPGAGKLVKDSSVPLVLVEAEKGVLALTAWAERVQRQILVAGLGGCWGWRGRIGKRETAYGDRVDEVGPLPELMTICSPGRKVVILLDSNARTNAAVQAARAAGGRSSNDQDHHCQPRETHRGLCYPRPPRYQEAEAPAPSITGVIGIAAVLHKSYEKQRHRSRAPRPQGKHRQGVHGKNLRPPPLRQPRHPGHPLRTRTPRQPKVVWSGRRSPLPAKPTEPAPRCIVVVPGKKWSVYRSPLPAKPTEPAPRCIVVVPGKKRSGHRSPLPAKPTEPAPRCIVVVPGKKRSGPQKTRAGCLGGSAPAAQPVRHSPVPAAGGAKSAPPVTASSVRWRAFCDGRKERGRSKSGRRHLQRSKQSNPNPTSSR